MFDKVVFAGGGHRCWWQAGFWEVLRAEIELRPRVIGAVSMGAFMACLVHANDTRRALAWYERELAGVRSNMAWLNLFRKDEPLFRQGGIYRKAMRALLGGEHFRQLMWQAPEIRVACAVAPASLSDRQLDRLGWREARRDARLVPASLHAKPERAEIFVPLVKRLQDCRTEREMCDLLQASSAYPPLVPPVEFEGERVVTGELVDPVPVDLVADVPGQTLVLTTRTYNRKTPVFAMEGRIYVQPSAPVPVASWDFTSARRFQQTYELGRQDAEAFLKLFGLGAFRTDVQFGGAMLAGGQWGDEARVDTVMDDGAAGAGSAGAGSAGGTGSAAGKGVTAGADVGTGTNGAGGAGRVAGAGGAVGVGGVAGAGGTVGVSSVAGADGVAARGRDDRLAQDANRPGAARDGVTEHGDAEGDGVTGRSAETDRAAGSGTAGSFVTADDEAVAVPAFTDDRWRADIGAAHGGDGSAGTGRDATSAGADRDLIDDAPLTLTDGHTLGEPSDKLFERAGRLPPRSGRKEDGRRAADDRYVGDERRAGDGRHAGEDRRRGDDRPRGEDRGHATRRAEHARKTGRKTEK